MIALLLCSSLVASAFVLAPSESGTASAHELNTSPVLELGSRGDEVRALQALLKSKGLSLTTTGVFDASTDSVLRSFQTSRGLPSTGKTSQATWDNLTPIISTSVNQSGQQVLAVSYLLKKRDPTVVEGTTFNQTMANKFNSFMAHDGGAQDGTVHRPGDWSRLLSHYDKITTTTSTCLAGLDDNQDWGESDAITTVLWAGSQLKGFYGPRGTYNDLSFEHGGDTPDHATHEEGLDIDSRPIAKIGDEACTLRVCFTGCSAAERDRYSYDRTRYYSKKMYNASNDHGRDHHMVTLVTDQNLINAHPNVYKFDVDHNDHFHTKLCMEVHHSASYQC